MVGNQDQQDVNSNPIQVSQDEEIGVDIEDQTKNQSKNINEWVYRGIQPPLSSVVLSDSDKKQVLTNAGEENGNETVIGLAESSSAWPRVTAERGWSAAEAPPPQEEDVSTSDQMSFSVDLHQLMSDDDQLISLSVDQDQLEKYVAEFEHVLKVPQGNPISENHGLSISSTAEVNKLKDNSDSKSNKRKIDEINHRPPSDDAEETVLEPVNKSDGGDQLEMKNTEQLAETADIHSPDNNSKIPMKNNNKKKQRRKRRKLSELEIAEKLLTPEPAKDKYKCRDCGMIFKTPQALGGHTGCHRKRKVVIHDTNKSEDLESHQMSAHGSGDGF